MKRKLIIGFFLFLAFAGGFAVRNFFPINKTSGNFVPLRSLEAASFNFINPLIGFDIAASQEFAELDPLKKELNNFLNSSELKINSVTAVGLYFRILNNGHWLGINEDTQFTPGSLFKVPIMVAYFKKADNDPEILAKKLESKTVEELIEKMIIDSDNSAKDILLKNIDQKYLEEVFLDIVGVPLKGEDVSFITPKIYANFFRRLHNATFLSREYSEKALEILSRTTFDEGLVAGLPQNISAAHKFGERAISENNSIIGAELHDCGIIYESANHYLVCVMTKGANINGLKETIKNISEIVYNFVKSSNIFLRQ